MTTTHRILQFLATGPKTNAELVGELDEVSPTVASIMARLRRRGLVVNLRPGNGKTALYAIAEAKP